MKYIGINEILEVNHLMEEQGLHFRIHLHDTCGRQSMWIEPLGQCACEGRYDEMYEVLNQYLEKKGFEITYSEDRLNLWITN